MKKITDTLSKEIIAAAEGEIVGIVTNGYTDLKLSRLRGCKISSEERDEGLLLPLGMILGEKEALIVRNLGAFSECALPECPIGAKVYDTQGRFFGILRDVCYDERSGEILSLIADESEIEPSRVIGFGKSAVILRAPQHDRVCFRKRRAKKSAKRKAMTPPAQTGSLSESVKELSTEPAFSPEISQEQTPEPAEQPDPRDRDYDFLLGRTVTKTIENDGTPIAREEETVTPDTIRLARLYGKLVELTVNSKRR